MLAQAPAILDRDLAPKDISRKQCETRRARELDPFSPSVASAYAWVLLFQRRFSESEREFRALLAGGPDYGASAQGLLLRSWGARRRESVKEYSLLAATDASPADECVLASFWPSPLCRDEARSRRFDWKRLGIDYVPCAFRAAVHFALASWIGDSRCWNGDYVEGMFGSKHEIGFDWDPVLRPALRVDLTSNLALRLC